MISVECPKVPQNRVFRARGVVFGVSYGLRLAKHVHTVTPQSTATLTNSRAQQVTPTARDFTKKTTKSTTFGFQRVFQLPAPGPKMGPQRLFFFLALNFQLKWGVSHALTNSP